MLSGAQSYLNKMRGGAATVDDYDPHDYRDIPKPTNNMETFMHVLKASLGTGILALPQSFARTGVLAGIVGTVLVGIMLAHCLQLLIKMQYRMCKIKRVPQMTYAQALEQCMLRGPNCLKPLAKLFGNSVDVFNITYQLGVCCVYIVFIAENFRKILEPKLYLSVTTMILLIALPLVVLNLIPNLKALAPLSLVANAITLAGLAVAMYYLIAYRKAAVDDPIVYVGDPLQVPLFFGTMLFALTSVPVVVSVERCMKTPKSYTKFVGVLNIGLFFIVILYTCVGVIGYLYCRSVCSDSFSLDMPQGFGAITVQASMIAAIFISYALHCYVPTDIIFNIYIRPRMERNKATSSKIKQADYALRIGLCLGTLILALAVPRLGLFISLFGALCLAALGMCFPTIMEICLCYPNEYGPLKIWLFKDILLFMFGLVGLTTGTYTAMKAIIVSFF